MTVLTFRPLCLALVTLFVTSSVRADLFEYVKRPEPAFAWKLKQKIPLPQGTVYDLHVVSQVWHGITWEHQLQIYQPRDVKPTSTMFLWNTGGGASPGNMAFGMELAQKSQSPVAFLYHVPNQPLLDGKKEDTLIAETFVRYLETKDESWPLLFPMVKSVVKAMDALQAFSEEEWKTPIKSFIVSGASKRGWTTWLTGAADPRVKAIAPVVIDTLNMLVQMDHQVSSFGKYSEQIIDYTARGLVPIPNTPEAKRLWKIVDPYLYRDRVTMPKFIVNGNNDPYWTVDALNLYWDDLKGDKWVMYVPNAGHNLQQQGSDGKPDRSRAVNGLAAFARHVIHENPMPRLSWKHDDAAGKLRVTVKADQTPRAARLWVADASSKDFRNSKWVAKSATIGDGTVVGEVSPPAAGYRAFYAELEYEIGGVPHQFSTQIRVAGPK